MYPKKLCYISGRGTISAGMRLLIAVVLLLPNDPSLWNLKNFTNIILYKTGQ